jgi:hypothetical protein
MKAQIRAGTARGTVGTDSDEDDGNPETHMINQIDHVVALVQPITVILKGRSEYVGQKEVQSH